MNHYGALYLLAIGLVTVGLVACDNTSDLTSPEFDTKEVEWVARFAVAIRPSTEAAEQMIFATTAYVIAEAPGSQTDFDLGNGISGTISPDGTRYWIEFSGMIEVQGSTLPVSLGRLVLSRVPDQLPGCTTYRIDYWAQVQESRRDEMWFVSGTATLYPTGAPVEYELTRTIQTVDGPGLSVVSSLTRMDVVISSAHRLSCAFDRVSMAGTITVDRRAVATVTITESCAHVDYINDSLKDVDVCATTASSI